VKLIRIRSTWDIKEINWQFGFTLWEIMVVIFLMGVMLSMVTPYFSSAINQVWNQVDLANKEKIEGAAQLYRLDVGTYPLNASDLAHSPIGVNGWRGPYLDEIPTNPFNAAQGYQINALGQVK